MVKSTAATVEEYIAELPTERAAVITQVRAMIKRCLPAGYVETMRGGMISYEIPLDRYPNTYDKQPLQIVGLASQKDYNSLYLMGVYGNSLQEEWLRAEYEAAGLKLDMDKSCLRFHDTPDLLTDVIGFLLTSTPPAVLIARYEANRKG
jgi:hypothetical protein